MKRYTKIQLIIGDCIALACVAVIGLMLILGGPAAYGHYAAAAPHAYAEAAQ